MSVGLDSVEHLLDGVVLPGFFKNVKLTEYSGTAAIDVKVAAAGATFPQIIRTKDRFREQQTIFLPYSGAEGAVAGTLYFRFLLVIWNFSTIHDKPKS
jgi:hypothetical protein